MNADHAYVPLGPCEDYEFELVEFVDGASARERRAAIERHLETCGRCRAFVREMIGVTESLALALPRVELSPDFDARLHARIAGLAAAASKDVARARADREYRGALASLRRGLTWRASLNAIASASVCGGLVVAGATLMPRLQQALDVAHVGPEALSLGIGAVGLVAGLVAALGLARRPWLGLAG
jgi:anti-sigma factor RsiW